MKEFSMSYWEIMETPNDIWEIMKKKTFTDRKLLNKAQNGTK